MSDTAANTKTGVSIERQCSTCFTTKSKEWRNIRFGPLQCARCYCREHVSEARKRRRNQVRTGMWER